MINRAFMVFSGAFVAAVLFPELLQAASGGEHHGGNQLADLGWRVLNFVIFAAIIYFAGAKSAKSFLGARVDGIRAQLESAEKAKSEAEAKASDLFRKMESLESEVREIEDTLRREGEVERDRIIEAAEAAAQKIKEQAKLSAEQELKRSVEAIKREAVEAALVLAEKMVSQGLGKEDQKRLVSEYVDSLGSVN